MLTKLKALNTVLTTECAEDGSLEGCTFYSNTVQEFKIFPAVGTKLAALDVLPTNSGTIIPQESEVILFVADLLENHSSNIVTLYDMTIQKLNIILGLVDGTTTSKIDVIDTFFLGSKPGVVVAMTINI